ncbi:lipopolysaccharide assembly protein LapA domain-containing protein [Geodermatophilus sp. SYSU D00705]
MTFPGSPVDPLATSTGAGAGTPGTSSGTTGAAGGSPAPAAAGRSTPARSTGRTIGRTLALALLLFVTVILVLFVVFNTQTVDVSLVFGNVDAPLVVALLLAAVLGGLVGWLSSLVLRARRRNR